MAARGGKDPRSFEDGLSLVETLPEGILFFDPGNRLLLINSAARQLLNIKKDHPPTEELLNLLEQRLDLRRRLEESLRLDHPARLEAISFGEVVLRIVICPVRPWQNGRHLGSLVVLYDITERIQHERQREDFTAMMVHELRSPLTTVYGVSDTLLKDFSRLKKEDIENSLLLIKNSAAVLLNSVNDLLDVAKIESGKFEIIKEEADLGLLLKSRLEFFRPLSQQKNLSLSLSLPGKLPRLSFDIVRLESVINNLLSNAVKYTPAGKISVSVRRGEGEVVVAVQDTGVGISPQELLQLFSKYKQLKPSPASGGKGTGLGLVIVKGIVEAHGGRVWVRSRLGRGSTFYFSLPL